MGMDYGAALIVGLTRDQVDFELVSERLKLYLDKYEYLGDALFYLSDDIAGEPNGGILRGMDLVSQVQFDTNDPSKEYVGVRVASEVLPDTYELEVTSVPSQIGRAYNVFRTLFGQEPNMYLVPFII